MLAACGGPVSTPAVVQPEAAQTPDIEVWRSVVELHELPEVVVEPAPVPAPSPPPEVVVNVPAPIDPRQYAPVLSDLPDHLMITSEMSADVPHSPPELARPGFKTVITRAALKNKDLPEEIASWIGSKVQLMGAKGVVCETTVRSFELVARYTPLSYTVDQWLGRVVIPGAPRMTLPQIAQAAFGERGANILLTAKVDSTCKGALWGRLAMSAAPAAAAAKPSYASSYDYGAALKTLSSFLRTQERYQTDMASSGLSSTGYWSDDRGLQVTAFERPNANRVVYLNARSTDDRYAANLTAMFEETPSGLEPVMEDGLPQSIVSMVDVDGDGTAEFVGPEVMVRIHRQEEVVLVVPPATVESEPGC